MRYPPLTPAQQAELVVKVRYGVLERWLESAGNRPQPDVEAVAVLVLPQSSHKSA